MGHHVPCSACGSSDAGWEFEDGGFYCYGCGHSDQAGRAGDPNIPPVSRKVSKLIEVEVSELPKRAIHHETAEKWAYGYGQHNGARVQVAQYRDSHGRVVAQKLRTADKKFTILGDIGQAQLFGQHLWKGKDGRTLVITEGEIDAMSMSQAMGNKWPVVSVPNGAQGAKTALLRQLEFLESYDKIIFMFDMDEPGRAGAIECAKLVTPGKAYIAELPLKDANEMLKAQRSAELMSCFWNAKQFRPDGLVTGEELWQHVIKADLARSVPYPYRKLNEMLRGARIGEVTTVVAGTGTGKSTFCKELAYSFILSGEKVGYVALEESVGESVLGLLGVDLNTRLTLASREAINTAEVRGSFDRIKDRLVTYDHWGSLDSENLIQKIRFLAKADGCTYIFLDHLSIVVSGMDQDEDERRTIDKVMTQLGSIAQEAQVGIVIVCHLKKPTGGGKTHEEGRPVTLDDLRGSGGIKQLSWNVISLERDQQDSTEGNVATLRVLKCRKIGKTGEAGKVCYDPQSGRLLDHEADELFGDTPKTADVPKGSEFE